MFDCLCSLYKTIDVSCISLNKYFQRLPFSLSKVIKGWKNYILQIPIIILVFILFDNKNLKEVSTIISYTNST